jgi:hypothetical protein
MRQKKEKKKWGLIIVTIFLMLGTTFGVLQFGFAPAGQAVRYNGIKFTQAQNAWLANVQGKQAAFTFLPEETENIFAFDDFSSKLQNRLEIDVTSDFNNTFRESIALAQYQMGLTMDQYNVFVRQGFTTPQQQFPKITCNDASENVPVIYFRQSNTTQISSQGSCIIAEASSNADLIRVKDRLLYGILGVIE